MEQEFRLLLPTEIQKQKNKIVKKLNARWDQNVMHLLIFECNRNSSAGNVSDMALCDKIKHKIITFESIK